jgi:FlaA1/EpsC-like NDP-sugar epimerase
MYLKRQVLVRVMKTVLDLAVLGIAFALAFVIRFEGRVPPDEISILTHSLPYVLLLKLVCLVALKVPRLTWRYVSLREAQHILVALSLASAILVTVRLIAGSIGSMVFQSSGGYLPLGVLLIDFLLSVVGTILLRSGFRFWDERSTRRQLDKSGLVKLPTVFIGAGAAGALVAREVAARPDLGIRPVGFLDDDPGKVGTIIHGLRVLGTTADLKRVVKEFGAAQALITIGHLSGANTRRLAELCARCGIPAKVIPGIAHRVNLSAIRDVAIEDVLRRDPVKLDNRAIAGIVSDRAVLVSGAGGSIGSELCRELCRYRPETLLLVEKAENNLFQIHRQLSREFPRVQLVPCIADICDRVRVRELFAGWHPSAVFHAAAHKHVPLMEWNPGEAIKNNVLGTRCLADVADSFGVARFVMISTDKAVNPTSIMGASKRIAELYIQGLSQKSKTRFVTVRFGNVLGSTGSVIPIFKEQIARGGPITVTHPEMRRYFMTIPEASQLVLQAGSMGKGGEIFILDMGEPVKIVDLARDLIRLSGFSQDDIAIEFTGIRPGEKLFEELTLDHESVQKTSHPKVFIGRLGRCDHAKIAKYLEELSDRLADCDWSTMVEKIREIVPEYQPTGEPLEHRLNPAYFHRVPERVAANGAEQSNGQPHRRALVPGESAAPS